MSEGKGNGKKGPPPRKPRLFEAFVVSAAGPGVAPVMMYCYAPRDANLMQFNAIPEFSFPESGLKLPPSSGEQDEAERAGLRKTFSFVLTGGDGARLHGFCRRYTTAAGTQEAACILTQHCWYDIFCKILDAFQDTACSQAGAAGVATFARNLQAQGLVEPGSAVRVPLEGLRELAFVRPLNTSKCHYDARLCELFRRLPVSKTVSPAPTCLCPTRFPPHSPSCVQDCFLRTNPCRPCADADSLFSRIVFCLQRKRPELPPTAHQRLLKKTSRDPNAGTLSILHTPQPPRRGAPTWRIARMLGLRQP